MEKEKRSSREIIRAAQTAKDWKQGPPDVEAVRLGRCPGCGAASRPVGGRVVLHGHGKRGRQVLGPEEPGGTPRQVEVQVRRYRCQACGATCTVAPREVWTRRHAFVCSRSAEGDDVLGIRWNREAPTEGADAPSN